jgi:hypothetical protein
LQGKNKKYGDSSVCALQDICAEVTRTARPPGFRSSRYPRLMLISAFLPTLTLNPSTHPGQMGISFGINQLL